MGAVPDDVVAAKVESLPLVSIGIPTYNRAKYLRSALDSVLAQDYPRIELIVSDNASTDATAEICRPLADSNDLVYVRRETNIGALANFRSVAGRAHGELFMWLGDDDELSENYVSSCVSVLRRDPEVTLVSGLGLHQGEGLADFREEPLLLDDPDPTQRVVTYYRRVCGNSVFYGLMRRELADRQCLRDVVGSDAVFVAGAVFMGTVCTVDSSWIRRNTSVPDRASGLKSFAGSTGSGRFGAWFPWVSLAGVALSDIGWHSPVYAPLTRAGRVRLGIEVAGVILLRAFGWQVERTLNRSGRALLRMTLTPGGYDVLRQRFRRRRAEA